MYEPVVLEKRKCRTLAGTPAGKFAVFTNCLKIGIPIGGMLLLSNFISKRRKIIAELDEYDPRIGQVRIFMDYILTSPFWERLAFQGVVHHVLQEYQKNGQLLKNIPPVELPKMNT